jgi:hypothetical protein
MRKNMPDNRFEPESPGRRFALPSLAAQACRWASPLNNGTLRAWRGSGMMQCRFEFKKGD